MATHLAQPEGFVLLGSYLTLVCTIALQPIALQTHYPLMLNIYQPLVITEYQPLAALVAEYQPLAAVVLIIAYFQPLSPSPLSPAITVPFLQYWMLGAMPASYYSFEGGVNITHVLAQLIIQVE